MKVSLEITMYPLTDGYKPVIESFLRKLNTFKDLEIVTNGMSTQVFGNYNDVMEAYSSSLKPTLEGNTPVAVVSKIINSHLPPDHWDSSQWK